MPDFKFLANYSELLHLEKPGYLIYAITGGRGSAKTRQTAIALLNVGASAKKRIVCLREIWTTIEDSVYTELVDRINEGFCHQNWRYNKTEIWNERTGSTIKFRGMLDRNTASRESLKGLSDVDIFWIDEAQTVTKATLEVFLPLLRKEDCCAIFTFNRINRRLPVWSCLFLDNPPSNTYLLETCYTQNKYLPQSFIDRANKVKEEFPEEYKRDYLNDPDTESEVRVVKYWSDKNIVPVSYIPEMDMHITCDFNRSPNCWILAHRTDEKYFFFDEFCKDMETADLIKLVLDTYPHPGKIIINGDASGQQGKKLSGGDILPDYLLIRNELIKRGYRQESSEHKSGKLFKFDLRPGNGSRKARFSAWNQKVIDPNGEVCIFADPKCKKLDLNCRELKIVPGTSDYDLPTKSEIERDPALRFLGHGFDDASYMVNTYHPVKAYHLPEIQTAPTRLNQNNFNHLER